jgi:outer membrane protein
MPRASSLRSLFASSHRLAALSSGLLALSVSSAAWAQDASLDQSSSSAEPPVDVSRWGLGVAAGVKQQPYTGAGNKTQGLPLIYFENR